jgi:hypothetical protein
MPTILFPAISGEDFRRFSTTVIVICSLLGVLTRTGNLTTLISKYCVSWLLCIYVQP